MITKQDLNVLKNIDIKTCDKNDLVDITSISIDKNQSKLEKLATFIESIKNPYIFKVGDTIVKIKFSENENTFQNRMEKIISNKFQ